MTYTEDDLLKAYNDGMKSGIDIAIKSVHDCFEKPDSIYKRMMDKSPIN